MDKTKTDKGKVAKDEVNKKILSALNALAIRILPEKVQELRDINAIIENDYKNWAQQIEKASKSFFADKVHFDLFKRYMELDYITSRNMYMIFYAIDCLEIRLANIEKIVQGIAEKVNLHVPNLKTQVESLQNTIKEPAFAEVHQFVQHMKKKIAESQHAGREYVE